MGRKTNEQKEIEAEQRIRDGVSTTPSADNPTADQVTPDPLNDVVSGGAPVKEKVEDTVEVKREDLNALLARVDKQAKDISLLYQAADKQKLSKAMNDGTENLIKTVKISTWDNTDGLVVGWKLVTNRCEVVLGRWIEEQTVNLILDNGEVLQVPLLEFYRKTLRKVVGDLVSKNQTTDAYGTQVVLFTVQLPSGRKIEINSAFVN
jgi:hypothetical protein